MLLRTVFSLAMYNAIRSSIRLTIILLFKKILYAQNRALNQFHELYDTSATNTTRSTKEDYEQLEEMYVMGHRIISFLTESLPRHPGLSRAPDVRERAKYELDLLWKCVEDVALQIDENICNQFIDDGDLLIDAYDDDDDDNDNDNDNDADVSGHEHNLSILNDKSESSFAKSSKNINTAKMVRFENCVSFPNGKLETDEIVRHDRKLVESPTSETVVTSGTESLEPLDTSYMGLLPPDITYKYKNIDETSRDRNFTIANVCTIGNDRFDDIDDDSFGIDDFYDDNQNDSSSLSSRCLYTNVKRVRLDFLDKISQEEVVYETDSEAADSWANGGDFGTGGTCLASSSGSLTCDPARIAFRDLMNRLPQKLLQMKATQTRSLSAHVAETTCDDAVLALTKREKVQDFRDECDENQMTTEQQVGIEIKDYLESSDSRDHTQFLEICQHKMKTTKHAKIGDTFIRPQGRTFIHSSSSSSSSSLPSLTLSSSPLSSLNSAFSSFERAPHQQNNEKLQLQHIMNVNDTGKTTSAAFQRTTPLEIITDNLFAQEDWISFDNYSNNSYFTA